MDISGRRVTPSVIDVEMLFLWPILVCDVDGHKVIFRGNTTFIINDNNLCVNVKYFITDCGSDF